MQGGFGVQGVLSRVKFAAGECETRKDQLANSFNPTNLRNYSIITNALDRGCEARYISSPKAQYFMNGQYAFDQQAENSATRNDVGRVINQSAQLPQRSYQSVWLARRLVRYYARSAFGCWRSSRYLGDKNKEIRKAGHRFQRGDIYQTFQSPLQLLYIEVVSSK
jgi:hypothetical protein